MLNKKGLFNKLSIPATLSEKQTSPYCSTIFIGTVILIPSIIISNIILQTSIPFVFGDEVNGLHLIFGGGGKDVIKSIIAIIIIFYMIVLTPLALLYHQYNKFLFWSMFSAFIMSYGLSIILMYVFNIQKDIIGVVLVLITIIWSILAILITNKGLRKVELE